MKQTTAVIVLVVLSSAAADLLAQDGEAAREWWQWGGPHRNFISDVTGLADSWPDGGPPVIWSRPLGAGHASIIAGRGRLFTMYRRAFGAGGEAPWSVDETVIAMDAATGETLWEYSYPSNVQDFGQGAGPHATPLLVGDRLFTIGTNKELHVFDATSGEIEWSRNFVTDFGAPPLLIRSMIKSGYGASPLPYHDTIIVQVGGPGQSVMALRQDDGGVVWRSGSFLVSEAPPRLITFDGEEHLVIFAGQAVHGLDPDTGEILWAHAHDAGNDFNFQVPLWSDDDDILFLSSGYIGGSRAIKLTRDGNATRTEELWYDPQLRFTFLNPLRIGNFVYGTSGQSATAIMTATKIATGETAWRARGYSRATMVHADGKVLLLEEDGDLTLATVTPAEMTTLATIQLFDTRAWTAPTLVGTTLYARDREKVVALDLSDGTGGPDPRRRR